MARSGSTTEKVGKMRQVSSKFLCALLTATALTAPEVVLAQDGAQPVIEDQIIIRGARIPDTKRATSEISAVIDAESFERTGDSDIGSALARVAGLSLSSGKFVVVRGLNERYSAVTINGSPLPSPEPLQRVAPLDIIPTSILAGSTVQKTFSPEFSGEFGGGSIDLQTKAVPGEFFLEIGGSVGLDTATTIRDGLLYDGGDTDWFGFDDGTRNFSNELAAVLGTGTVAPADQEALDLSIENSDTLLITENTIPVNYGIDIAGGTSFVLSDDIVLGFTAAAGFSSDWQTREGVRQQGFLTTTAVASDGNDLTFESTTNVVDANAVATVGLEVGDNHEFTFTNLILRSTLKEARITQGNVGDLDRDTRRTNTDFFERQVWQTQIRGEHVFPSLMDLSAEWRFAYGEAFRDAPYNRENSYIDDGTGTFRYDRGNDVSLITNSINFSKIEDENIDIGADFLLPFEAFNGSHTFKFGYSYTEKDRVTLSRTFQYADDFSLISADDVLDLTQQRIDVLYGPNVVGTGLFDLELIDSTDFLDNSASELTIQAYYGGFDVEVGPYVRVAAGVRYEDGRQSTSSFATGQFAQTFSATVIDEDYFLPAATVTWNPIGDLQVRAGFSQTVTRPQFRELSPAFFLNEDTDSISSGNSFLTNTEINNYDVRAEYYFSRGQFVTLGAFYKELDNPIENALIQRAGDTFIESFINAPSAELWGFEFEFEKNFVLADLVDWSIFSTKDLVIKTNYTYSQSDVSDNGNVSVTRVLAQQPVQESVITADQLVVDGRALQGQSDHLFNLQLGVEDAEYNSRATFLLNWASKRIRDVGTPFAPGQFVPDVIERPPFMVDFVYTRGFEKFGGDWELGFKVRNILGDDYEATQGFADGTQADYDLYDLGRELSVSLKRVF